MIVFIRNDMNLNKLFLEILSESMPELLKEVYGNGINFEEYVNDSYKGETFGGMNMFLDGKVVAYVEYTKYNDEIFIGDIKAIERGKGYGVELMKHLASIYGYENLNRGMLTPDGVKMRQKLDKHFNFDPIKHEESKNKHMDPSVLDKIPNDIIREFLKHMIKNGYQEAWATYMSHPDFRKLSNFLDSTYDFDFNDISIIAEWIKGSPTNNHDPEDEVPDWVEEMLTKIIGLNK